MNWLSRGDLQILMNCIREIYSDLYEDGWHYRLLFVISKAIPCNVIAYNKIDPLNQQFVYHQLPQGYVSPEDAAVYETYMHEHPCINVLYPSYMVEHPFKKSIENRLGRAQPSYIRHPEGAAIKISDLLTNNQFHRLGLYNEFFRKCDVEFQIAVPLACRPDVLEGIAVNRDGKDFTERDRLMLNLLAPHIIKAYDNAVAVSSVRWSVQASADSRTEAINELTLRESEVLRWLAQGKSNAEIARILNISIDTIKKHMMKIYQKLGVENRTTAALLAANLAVRGKRF